MTCLPVDVRKLQERVRAEILGETQGILGLHREIELVRDGVVELIDQAHWRIDPAFWNRAFHQRSEHVQQPQVARHGLDDAGALDFDDHFPAALAGAKAGAVNLRNTACRQGVFVDGFEQVGHRSAERTLKLLANGCEAHRRYGVLQFAQLGHHLQRNEIGTGRGDLS
jgi:hypothetical protein